jgi:LAO/AO transport system kinase
LVKLKVINFTQNMSAPKKRFEPSAQELAKGLQAGNRTFLSRAITLAESKREEDQATFYGLLSLLAAQPATVRIGISGVPGVGKSTFIEAFGTYLTEQEKHVAVLAVDPSSERTRGSILGDKTRMESLSRNPRAFIRPTPAGSTLGGVANSTQKTIRLCEAAGYDVVLVETVGVGQSETTVRHLVDFFLVLMLPGAGDELQGIKKGILELADALVINKADGDNLAKVKLAKAELQQALHYLLPSESGWTVPVLTCSALKNEGIAEVWSGIESFVETTVRNGYFDANRRRQKVHAFEQQIQDQFQSLLNNPLIKKNLETLRHQVAEGELAPDRAAQQLWQTVVDNLLHP